jgi:hypothetical protein
MRQILIKIWFTVKKSRKSIENEMKKRKKNL